MVPHRTTLGGREAGQRRQGPNHTRSGLTAGVVNKPNYSSVDTGHHRRGVTADSQCRTSADDADEDLIQARGDRHDDRLAGLELDPGRYALFAAARVDPTKGCLDLIKAWRTMDCPTPLLVVGDLWHAPGYESDLKAAADGMAIHFLPRIEDKAVLAGLVASADVFVFPSTVEAMSMMLLEAMALGVLPIHVVDTGHPRNRW